MIDCAGKEALHAPNFEKKSISPLAPPYPRTQALSSKTFEIPPIDGSLTIPEIYDWHLTHTPEHPIFEFIDADGETRVIKYPEACRAIYKASQLMRERMGDAFNDVLTPKKKGKIIAIVANPDVITYYTTIMGILRAGYVCFPISPRNSPTAVAHLLSKTSSAHVIVGREKAYQDLVSAALASLKEDPAGSSGTAGIPFSLMPLFEDLYLSDWQSNPAEPPPYGEPTLEDICMIVHSSGSTAFPKPIYWSHRFYLSLAIACQLIPEDWCGRRVGIHFAAMYHSMGIALTSWTPTAGITLNPFRPQSPTIAPTPQSVIQGAIASKSDLVFCTPTFIEVWSRSPDIVDHLTKLSGVLYGGGPLNRDVGNYLSSRGVKLCNAYGSTETGSVTSLVSKADLMDWEYLEIGYIAKTVFKSHGNNQFELIILKNDYHQPCLINTKEDGIDGYATSDLFEPHPTKQGLWKIVGRVDDQIMHSTGEKTNPGPLESLLNQDQHIQSAIMFGRGRFHAGVLVDPKILYKFDPNDGKKLAEFRNLIWPTVEAMNAYAPQHSRIFKEMILVANPDKPVSYTAKNTPRRLFTINAYADEIEAIYDAVDETTQADIESPTVWDYKSSLEFTKLVVSGVMKKPLDEEDDIYEHGCDSLQTTWIRNSLLRALEKSAKIETRNIPNNFVYQHPTIHQLADFVYSLAGGGKDTLSSSTKVDAMLTMLDKYSADFPVHRPTAPMSEDRVVLLTGSTGALGCNILVHLVKQQNISRIYLLNRKAQDGSSLYDRQREALYDKGLSVDILDSDRVILLEGQLTEKNFGLAVGIYESLRQTVTHIIHNAWRVNFNVALPSFESNIQGLRNLVDFALSSPLPSPARIIFTSTVGIFRNVNMISTPIPEEFIGADISAGSGYSESKWISEKILENAASKTPLRPVIVRVGQLSGGENGAWNESEWFPSIVRSAPHVKCLPSLVEPVSWIPVHVAAAAVVDFLNSYERIVHLLHPHPVLWSDIFIPISSALGLPLVSYEEWLKQLESCRKNGPEPDEVELMKKVPALKLLEFFRGLNVQNEVAMNGHASDRVLNQMKASGTEGFGIPALSMQNALNASPTLADPNLGKLDVRDAMRWLSYWHML